MCCNKLFKSQFMVESLQRPAYYLLSDISIFLYATESQNYIYNAIKVRLLRYAINSGWQ